MKENVFRQCYVKVNRSRADFKRTVSVVWRRALRTHARHAYSNFWIPPLNLVKSKGESIDSNDLLLKAGYLRQAYAGIYHMLPLGLRVQSKIEALIEKHMGSLQASKLSLSLVSSQELWRQSGRFSTSSEIFKFRDRKETGYLLSPTHEEEITMLVGSLVNSYRDLPIRVYQIGRKYRDEKRPRGGLLRGREFVMKDLYTFDGTDEIARKTYDTVREAYRNFFDELKIDYIEAQADSGNMGGSLSHEYHLESDKGEDNILCCSECDFARNEELVDDVTCTHEHLDLEGLSEVPSTDIQLNELLAISNDRRAFVKAYSQSEMPRQINPHAVKTALSKNVDLDMGVEEPFKVFTASQSFGRRLYYVFDDSVTPAARAAQLTRDYDFMRSNALETIIVSRDAESARPLALSKKQSGDACPVCEEGHLTVKTAIEAGHTFHLGTRYSAQLGANVASASGNEPVPMVMGCHGIGVSRLIAAAASCLADEKGLNWPRAIAPFQVAIVPRVADALLLEGATGVYDSLTSIAECSNTPIDAIIDDRADTPLAWKLNDADLVGYPVLVILGRAWAEQKVEIQCRRLKVKATFDIADVRAAVEDLLRQL